MTYAWRGDTSICESSTRTSSNAIATVRFGENATATNTRFDGRWVKTMVGNRPKRSASQPDDRNDAVCNTPNAKNVAPTTPTEAWKRWLSQNATNACTVNPPA